MRKLIAKAIKQRIVGLTADKQEHEAVMAWAGEETLLYARCDLAVRWIELYISLLDAIAEAIDGGKCEEPT